jgi:hypothetical protein
VRNIPEHVDRALRRKAREERKSLNEVVRGALIREAAVGEPAVRSHADQSDPFVLRLPTKTTCRNAHRQLRPAMVPAD